MSSLLISLFFVVIILLSVRSTVILGYDDDDDKDLFKQCPPSRCSRDGPEVRFPLRLQSSPTSCGLAELSCSASNQTILSLPYPGPYMVLAIDYPNHTMTIKPLRSQQQQQHPCPFRNLSSINSAAFGSAFGYYYNFISSSNNPASSWSHYYYYNLIEVILVSCSKRLAPTSEEEGENDFAGPISCLSGADHFVYAADAGLYMDILPLECMVVSTVGMIPPYNDTFRGSVEAFDQGLRVHTYTIGFGGGFFYDDESEYLCRLCEADGKRCGWNQQGDQIICVSNSHHGNLPSLQF